MRLRTGPTLLALLLPTLIACDPDASPASARAVSAISFGGEVIQETPGTVSGCQVAFCLVEYGCRICGGATPNCAPYAGCMAADVPGNMGSGEMCSQDGCAPSGCFPAFCDAATGICTVCDDGDPATPEECTGDPASPCRHVPAGPGEPPPWSPDVTMPPSQEYDAVVVNDAGPVPDVEPPVNADLPPNHDWGHPTEDVPQAGDEGPAPGDAGPGPVEPEPWDPVDPGHCTYTQGGWGQGCRGKNVGCLRDSSFGVAFPAGLELGGHGSPYAIRLSSAAAVEAFLPQGGPSGVLKASLSDPKTGTVGVLAGQATALALNVGFDDAGLMARTSASPLGDLVLTGGPYQGARIRDLLRLAHEVIGGRPDLMPAGTTLSDLNAAMDAVNNGNHCEPAYRGPGTR